MQYIVPSNKIDRVDLLELDSLIETEVGYPVSVNLIGQYLVIDGLAANDETVVNLLIDEYLKDPDPAPEVPTTQVIATGLDIRSLTAAKDTVTVVDGGNSITVDGEVALSPATLAALEFINATIQSDATIDMNRIRGALIDIGVGDVGSGTQRVVLASDSPSLPVGATQSGTWTVAATQSGTWNVRPNFVSGTSTSGTTISSSGLVASLIVKASSGNLYKIIGYNNLGSDQFIQIFNTTTLPADGVAPHIVQKVLANQNFEIDFGDVGIFLSTGIVVCNSSTVATKTIGAANCWINAVFK